MAGNVFDEFEKCIEELIQSERLIFIDWCERQDARKHKNKRSRPPKKRPSACVRDRSIILADIRRLKDECLNAVASRCDPISSMEALDAVMQQVDRLPRWREDDEEMPKLDDDVDRGYYFDGAIASLLRGSVRQPAMEAMRRLAGPSAPKTNRRDEAESIKRLRAAIAELGRTMKPEAVLRKAEVNDREGRRLLRQLQSAGEFEGFVRKSRPRP